MEEHVRQRLRQLVELGIPLSLVARNVKCHSATLSKFLCKVRPVSHDLVKDIDNAINILKEQIKMV